MSSVDSSSIPGQKTLVRHELEFTCDGEIVTAAGELFDTTQYSRMKFGSMEDARDIGIELGQFILENAQDVVLDERKITSPFMYKHVPSAAHTIAKYAFAMVNAQRAAHGLDRIHTRQIYINSQPNADYSKLGKEDRMKYMQGSGLELVADSVSDHNILLLDDIKITGTYASLVWKLVEEYDINSMVSVYWAAVNPVISETDPSIENQINSSALPGLDLLKDIITNGTLVPTLRTLKVLLSHADSKELEAFLHDIPSSTLLELYEGAVGTGIDLRQMYEDNYRLLERLVRRKIFANKLGEVSLRTKKS